ncbi:protein of unknown function [Xenorhabdus poinarii G6]|uniref:Uncharacterized protein n=1 Tax=Xenorhabdus poinarii G6 TaxID=1354304 RepID=A0A068R4Y6_9GAMM|nr:protein of unknown function [Xenorhabdus poinarii G6]
MIQKCQNDEENESSLSPLRHSHINMLGHYTLHSLWQNS